MPQNQTPSLVVKMDNIHLALAMIGSLRATADPVSEPVQQIRQTIDCCEKASKKFVGFIGVPDADTSERFKNMRVCACCQQLHIDEEGRKVEGSIRDYITNLVTKHGEIKLYISNPKAILPIPPPGARVEVASNAALV